MSRLCNISCRLGSWWSTLSALLSPPGARSKSQLSASWMPMSFIINATTLSQQHNLSCTHWVPIPSPGCNISCKLGSWWSIKSALPSPPGARSKSQLSASWMPMSLIINATILSQQHNLSCTHWVPIPSPGCNISCRLGSWWSIKSALPSPPGARSKSQLSASWMPMSLIINATILSQQYKWDWGF